MAIHVSKSKEPSRRIPSWVLGGVLSLILVTFWALYLTLAPVPTTVPPDAPAGVSAPPAASGELRVLVWRRVLPGEVIAGFEADTGLKVIVDNYDTLAELQALAAGGLSHDLVLTSGIGLKRLADAGLLSDLSPDRLSNSKNLDPAITARAAAYDPENHFGVVAAWGTLGLAFDQAKIAARQPADAPLDTWSVLFNPDRLAKLSDCGVQVVDTPRGAFPIALRYLGLPPESGAAEDTETATRLWEGVRGSISKFASSDIVESLALGDVCLALATSGDVYRARAMIAAAGRGPELRYVIPQEGTVAWFALFAIPKAAPNPDNARKLIDYLLRPEVAARATNATGLANAVAASALYVKPEIKNDPALMPPADEFAKFIVETDISPEAGALRDRFWQLINTPPTVAPGPPAAEPPPAGLPSAAPAPAEQPAVPEAERPPP
ncbi:MAG: extracellular solute-binding protein [Rhodospirillaceae bacterium]